MNIILKNEQLQVTIAPLGAQMVSVLDREGTEYIWQADPAVWGRHAPLLFPVIGRLKDGAYTLGEKTYHISPHGFARDSLFTVTEQSAASVSLQLTESPETLEKWPFAFVLTVTFTLYGNQLTKCCTVKNSSDDVMYYELGSHDGFRAPLNFGEHMDDYAIVLPGVTAICPYGMDEQAMLTPKGERRFSLKEGRIELKPSSYGLDTVIVDELPSRTAELVDQNGAVRVKVEFQDYPYLGIWTQDKPFDTNYVCIEPWSALPDGVFVGRDLREKRGIRSLQPGQKECLTYTTTFCNNRASMGAYPEG